MNKTREDYLSSSEFIATFICSGIMSKQATAILSFMTSVRKLKKMLM